MKKIAPVLMMMVFGSIFGPKNASFVGKNELSVGRNTPSLGRKRNLIP
jgi:hypothetical protein